MIETAQTSLSALDGQLARLRALLRRRILWLRRRWKQDPLEGYRTTVISDEQADCLVGGEAPDEEARFYAHDPEAAALSHFLEEAETGPAAPGFAALQGLFGLSRFELDVVLLCLAPELDPAFERLYAYVQDDLARKYPTPHLAMALFGGDPGAFLPRARLRRFRIVQMETGVAGSPFGARPMRLEEAVLDYLRGAGRPDERISAALAPVAPEPLTPAHEELAGRLEEWVRSRGHNASVPLLNLVGPAGAGKRAVAAALCRRLGLPLYRVDAGRLPAPRQESLELLERDALLLQMALLVEGNGEAEVECAEHVGTFIIAAGAAPIRTQRPVFSVRISKPGPAAQATLWSQVLEGAATGAECEALAQQFDFGPGAIAQAAARARASGNPAWQVCREHAGWQVDELAQRILPVYTWDDIVLPEDALCQLREIAAQVRNRQTVYEHWGFGRTLSRGRGISALFSGPSGTGKTMAAEVLASALDLDLFRIDLAGVVSKYIGETEKNLRKVFDAAESSGAILLFDEADALFGKRTEVKDSHDRYANIEINYLLQRMEDYRGVALLSTNRKAALDRAFLRRLRFLVEFPFPGAEHREQIWRKSFPAGAPLEGVDFQALARMEIAGGNIRNVALNAAFLAAAEGTAIGMGQVMRAAAREYAKIERLATEAEFGSWSRS